MIIQKDKEFMELALSLAKAARGQTSPNPAVGAVVVKDGELAGVGSHLKAGTPHAEVHAIRSAGDRARGAVLYVTLEPCSHHGKTPPCADLIVESGIKKVFVASLDPNPLVSGKGIERLKQAGIDVVTGLGQEEAEQLNQPFFHFIQTKKPFVTLKVAVSLDGKTATKTGDSKWITSPEARGDVHSLRHEHDAILVGINTILQDDPLLTARLPEGGRNPIRIVLDTQLRIPLTANVVQDKSVKTIIFTAMNHDVEKAIHLQEAGTEVVALPTETIHIQDVLSDLGERHIMSLLVEGGAEVHASFVAANAFQQVIFYLAPKLIGGSNAKTAIGGSGIEFVQDATQLEFVTVERIGPDVKIIARPMKLGQG